MWGLRVPGGIGDRLTLRALRESRGHAIAVSDESGRRCDARSPSRGGDRRNRRGGRDSCGATPIARRAALGFLLPIVLFNTATSLKYAPRRADYLNTQNVAKGR